MRNSAIATSAILFLSCVAIIADMTKQGHMEFTSAADIKKALPNITPPEFAKVIEGNDKGCLTKPSQTKPITIAQIRTLRQLTDPQSISVLLGNAYCETDKGFRWITESGKQLDLDKALDYEFSSSESNTLTNTKKRTSKETNGSADRSLQPRVSPSNTLTTRETVKNP
jgi:hypothetical protein